MATEKALIVTKGINGFPSNNEKIRGNIDIWWVVRILLTSSPWLPPEDITLTNINR